MLEYLLSTDLVDIVLLIMGMSYEEVYLIELGKKIYNFRISSRCSSSDRLVGTENHKFRLRILHHSDILLEPLELRRQKFVRIIPSRGIRRT